MRQWRWRLLPKLKQAAGALGRDGPTDCPATGSRTPSPADIKPAGWLPASGSARKQPELVHDVQEFCRERGYKNAFPYDTSHHGSRTRRNRTQSSNLARVSGWGWGVRSPSPLRPCVLTKMLRPFSPPCADAWAKGLRHKINAPKLATFNAIKHPSGRAGGLRRAHTTQQNTRTSLT